MDFRRASAMPAGITIESGVFRSIIDLANCSCFLCCAPGDRDVWENVYHVQNDGKVMPKGF
jgi:hypothetical protein